MTEKRLSIRLAAVGGDKVKSEFNNISKSGSKAFNQITRVITPANNNLVQLNKTTKTLNNVLKQTSYIAGTYLGFQGLKGSLSFLIDTNRSFEQLSNSLKTVTGSAQNARTAFQMIEDFASSTPYQIDEIVTSFIRLKAMGLEPTTEALTSYGNTASAFGKNIIDFTDAVTSATVGEFERLKAFGIKASVEGEKVKFHFQGTTKVIGKNAKEIEGYLQDIGKLNFAGAMNEQMSSLNGVISNIGDNFSKLARTAGLSGLNSELNDALSNFNNLISSGDDFAKGVGKTLGNVISIASDGVMVLIKNIDLLSTVILSRLGGNIIAASFGSLTTGLKNLNIASKSAIAGFTMLNSVSKLASYQMLACSVASKTLKSALSLIGGPAGLAVLLGVKLIDLAKTHDVVSNATREHSKTLQKLKQEFEDNIKEISKFNKNLKNEELANWGNKLQIAKKNIKALREEIKRTGGLSLWDRTKPKFMSKEYEVFANDLKNILSASKIDIDDYEKGIWELASEYPEFEPKARKIKEQILLLKAAEDDYFSAKNKLNDINNPKINNDIEVNNNFKQTSKVDEKDYKKLIDDINSKMLDLETPYNKAIILANKWKSESLNGLDETKAGYEGFKEDINLIYEDMIRDAKDTALKTSTNLGDGFKRGFDNVKNEVNDFASLSENMVKNSFNNMEDSLVKFVTTGKLSFTDLTNSIISDMARIAIRQSITQPLMMAVSSYFGTSAGGASAGTAHTGALIGSDSLSSKSIDMNVFSGAKKYHTGGMVGLNNDEVPIIAQKGEAVFTKGQLEVLGGKLNNDVHLSVNIINNASNNVEVSANKRRDNQGNVSLDIMVEQIESVMNKNISKGTGIAPNLERKYGLNPANGIYG